MSTAAHDKTLILMRHAEAAAGPPGGADHDRELTEQGARDARLVGSWLRDAECVPELVLCSTSIRARQTWRCANEGGLSTEFLEYRRPIYTGDAQAVLQVIREEAGESEVVLLVGHNPTVMQLASMLCGGSGSVEAHEALARGFAPGGAAVLRFSGSWEGLDEDAALLDRFHVATVPAS